MKYLEIIRKNMRIKLNLLAGFAAALALTACSSDSSVNTTSEKATVVPHQPSATESTQSTEFVIPPRVKETEIDISGLMEKTSESFKSDAFARDLFAEMKENIENQFVSPYSISTALVMLYGGAAGVTAEELGQVLGSGDAVATLNLYAGLQDWLTKKPELSEKNEGNTPNGDTLNIANSLWPNQGFPFRQEYIRTMQDYLSSEVYPTDYSKVEEARGEINQWVENKTENLIKDLIQPGVLSENTQMTLVNAIYFKGSWEKPFDKKLTQNAQFTLLDGSQIEVPFMSQQENYHYYGDETLQIVRLPYRENRSMVIILPRDTEKFAEVREAYCQGKYQQTINQLSMRKVNFKMPRFKMSQNLDLNDLLIKMGVGSMFDPEKADFSGMYNRGELPNLFVSKVIHQAFVEVDEVGTEAAAATAGIMLTKAMPQSEKPEVMIVDRPFIILIKENISNQTLFEGQVMNPVE